MKLLVFEYSSICLYDNLLSEGYNMLKSILNDLENDCPLEVYYLINRNIKFPHYDNLKAVYVDDDLFGWLKKHSSDYDYCLFVAPEDNLIQYKITKILEENGVSIIGCDSKSSYTCSSKTLTYESVPEDILKIKSFKIKVEKLEYKSITRMLNEKTFLIKPDDRTSSDLIFIIDDNSMCEKIKKIYMKNNMEYLLVQEYIEGTPISVSLVSNNKSTSIISINSQEIKKNNNKIQYIGCKTPLEHPLKRKLNMISGKIVKSIPGLMGFAGIDYIVQNENIFFVEINSRITTPYIVLQRNCKQNLTGSIIDYVLNDRDKINLTFEKQGKFIR